MDNFRLDLEQTIIGACLLENGYSRIASVLTYRNFTTTEYYDHRLIFEAIERLYPARPIDLITVVHEVNRNGYAYYLAGCAAKVCSSDNLQYHALILLQLGMRDTLIQLLDKARGSHVSNTTHAAIQEIIDECLDTGNDIVQIYHLALIHLEAIGAESFIVDEVRSLHHKIDKKVNYIKSQVHVDSLIKNLLDISKTGSDTNTRLAICSLADNIKALLVKGVQDSATLEKLLSIRV